MRASIAYVSILCAVLISPAWADNDKNKGHDRDHSDQGGRNHNDNDQDHGHGNAAGQRNIAVGPQGQQIVIGDHDRDAVHNWYRNEYAAGRCPPGLAKKNNGCLPPGQAQQRWTMGQPLPPQVPYYPMPQDLRSQLAPPPPGYEYARVDNDVVMMQNGTRLISGLLGNLGSLGR